MTRTEILTQIQDQLTELSDADLEMLALQLGHKQAGTSFFSTAPKHVRDDVLQSLAEIEAGVECIPHEIVMADAQRRIDNATQ